MGNSEINPIDALNPINGFEVQESEASDGSIRIIMTIKTEIPFRYRVFVGSQGEFQDLVHQLRNLPHWTEKLSQ